MTERIKPPAPRPCESCPYRGDVPAGVWVAEEYEKLPRYDAPTPEQPARVFLCHQRPGNGARVCAGWAGCHDGDNLLALRFAVMQGSLSPDDAQAVVDYTSPVPLFGSGAEAAAHGVAGIARPGVRAQVTIAKITRVRPDVR